MSVIWLAAMLCSVLSERRTAHRTCNSCVGTPQVLQQAPAKSAVYGMAPPGAALEITVASAADISYTVKATATAKGSWLAYLKPATDKDVTITAHCAQGCTNTTDAALEHVTFGDVSCADCMNTPIDS